MPWYPGINTGSVQGVSNVQRRIRSKEELLRRHACDRLVFCFMLEVMLLCIENN